MNTTEVAKDAKRKSTLKKVTMVLAVLVALVTTYALIMPAVTITGDAASSEEGFFLDDQQIAVDASQQEAAEPEPTVAEAVPETEVPATDLAASPTESVVDTDESQEAAAPEADAEPEPETAADAAAPEEATEHNSETGDADAAKDAPTDHAADAPESPEQDLSAKVDLGDGLTLEVRAQAEKGILPEGTAMQLGSIPEDKSEAVIALMQAEAEEKASIPADMSGVIATDIQFLDANGNTVDPKGKVLITMTCPVIEQDAQFALVHVTYAKHPEDPEDKDVANIVLLKDQDLQKHQLRFEAIDFSPYAIVYVPPAEDENIEAVAEPAEDGAEPAEDGAEPAEDGAEPAEDGAEPADGDDSSPETTTDDDDSKLVTTDDESEADAEPESDPVLLSTHPQSFTAEALDAGGNTITVAVDAEEGTFPEGVTMQAAAVSDETVLDAAKAEAAGQLGDRADAAKALAVDITFTDAEGNAIEPAKPVRVAVVSQGVAEAAIDQLAVVHVSDDATAQVVESSEVHENLGAVYFDADAFSAYALVYTVDFHYEINGKSYDMSLAGGDAASFRELAQTMHLVDSAVEEGEPIDEDIDQFLNEIEDVQFSDPDLMCVLPVDEGITAGGLKQKYDLQVEYSADLTQSQIDAMNERVFYNPDYALVSVKPFDTQETLTVTMQDGAAFTIEVTDAQISQNVLAANGETYTITVTYGDEAEIPEGAQLDVREIEAGTSEFVDYANSSAMKLGAKGGDISFARFFDICIMADGDKVEPKAPVQVDISYADAMEISDSETLSVVHFADRGAEVITDVDVSEDGTELTYMQNGFSVTGTIINSAPTDGQQVMVIVRDGDRYYIVNNDASLTEVGYDETTGKVIVANPMLWTSEVTVVGNEHRHLYFHSEATGFETNLLASDYYRRYLDPSSANAWLQEQSQDNGQPGYVTVRKTGEFQNEGSTVETIYVDDRVSVLDATDLTIGENGTISHGSRYLGIQRDDSGKPVRLVSQEGSTGAAEFIFATASELPSGLHLDNAVNHIDISIQGTAGVSVPLAYGEYYLNPEKTESITINSNTTVKLGEGQLVNPDDLIITAEDMKRATISAYNQDGEELDDVFYITGYSANTTSEYSTVQVRMEGKFLVSDLRGTEYEHVDGTRYDGNWSWPITWPDASYVNDVRQARLDNIIDYTVAVVKPLEFYLTDTEGRQLYDSDGSQLTVTVDVAFSGTFNYWDDENSANGGNECPPIQGNADWHAGDIPSHDMSGMDFKLGGDAENPKNPLVAIEITKVIMDDEGNLIELKNPVTNTFDIMENKAADRNGVAMMDVVPYSNGVIPTPDSVWDGYTKLRSKDITVGESGMALIYDYKVTDAMYYIVEHHDTDSLPETVEDKSGQEWTYERTYIETEYVRRGDGVYDDKTQYPNPMHVSSDYTRNNGSYRSIPEVAGNFITMDNQEKKSGFLEFFVYNIYTAGKKLPVRKAWAEGTDAPEGASVTFDLYYAKRLVVEGGQTPAPWPDKDEYTKVIANQDGFGDDIVTSLTVNANDNWEGEFGNLPKTVKVNGVDYEIDYYAKEAAVTVGEENVIGDYQVTDEVIDGTVVVTNERDNTKLDVEKTWAEGIDVPEGTEVTVELRYFERKIKNADGTTPNPIEEWPENKSVYKPVKNDSLFASDPIVSGADLTTELVLKANTDDVGSWKGCFTGLPKTLVDAEGNVYEIDYYAVETAVKIPGEGKTIVDDDAIDATERYFATANKVDAEDEAAQTSDGTVTIENRKATVEPKVNKTWSPEPTDSNAFVTVQLKRYVAIQQEPTTEATVVKVWEDESNKYNKRPESLNVTLSNGQSVTLNEANGWSATVTGLPKYEKDEDGDITGTEIPYTWTEEAVSDYKLISTEVNGTTTTLTNRYTYTSATIAKVWNDAENQDGIRPASLNATLSNGDTVTLSEDNNWTATISDLPGFDSNGTPIAYSWTEANVEGYTLSDAKVEGTITTLTNTHEPLTTSATIAINWDDQNNKDGSRPSSLTATLSDGQTVTLNAANNWTATIDDLPRYSAGQEIAYTWTAPAVEGYELTNTANEDTTTTLTYFHEPPEKDTVTVTIYTMPGEDLPDGWTVNVYNVLSGNDRLDDQLGNMYMTDYTLRPISFEVPRNTIVSFDYATGGDAIVNSAQTQSAVTLRTVSESDDHKTRTIKFKAGSSDVAIYMIISGPEAQILPEPPAPEPKYMKVTINLIMLDGNESEGFGWNPLKVGVYQDPYEDNKEYIFEAQSANSNSSGPWVADNVRVETDLGETITYRFERSGNYWNLDNDDMVVVSSPDAQLSGVLSYFNDDGNNSDLTDKISLVAQEGEVTINVTVGPKSVLQNEQLADRAASPNALMVSRVNGDVVNANDAVDEASIVNEAFFALLPEGGTEAVPDNSATSNADASVVGNTDNIIAEPASKVMAGDRLSSSGSAPEGYKEDKKFARANHTLTLRSGSGWSGSFGEQDKYDAYGNEYIYYVEEIDYAPTGYQLTSTTGEILSDSGVTLTNEMTTGALKLTKFVKVNNNDPQTDEEKALTDGTYKFTVEGNNITKNVEITFSNG